MGFFSFFENLFSKNADDVRKKKELTKILKTFKSGKYHYISKEKTILGPFLTKVWTVFTALKPIKSLLEQTIFSDDERKALASMTFVAQSFLPKELLSLVDSFSEEIMQAQLTESDNQTKTLKSIDNDFVSYKNNYNSNVLSKFQEQYEFLYDIYNLATFDYEGFFRFFDRTFISNQPNQPCYHPVNGIDVINDVKDISYLISSMPTKIDCSEFITAIYNRISDKDCKVLVKNITSSINQIYKLLDDDLSHEKLLNMCKYITGDIHFQMKVHSKAPEVINKIKKYIEDNYKKSRENVIKEINENSIEKGISELFPKTPLEKIDGYESDLNIRLASGNYQTINYIQPLRVTKTFIKHIYEPKIKEAINTLIIEGYFSDQDYQKQLADLFFELNNINIDFKEDEQDLHNGSYSFDSLESFLIKTKVPQNVQVIKMISMINNKIFQTNRSIAKAFYNFAPNLYDILKDYKEQKATKISNLAQIKGVQNKEFIQNLANSYSAIVKYCKIMKTFLNKKDDQE